ncbi:peptidoglycan DD-metalloendopeptidase family protein [Salinithrix halophila]|uniref:Peptidoglycan DD-metalloendopeptidase family protein n=1 Tax=Salinithrix halophila TaxID=1485204 RepID=A0ABV8JI01_9BACL
MQKRRVERMRKIREGKPFPDYRQQWGTPVWKKETLEDRDELPWNRPQWMERERKKKREGRFLLQTFAAFLLLTGTYLVFQSQVPAGREVQTFISQVMERDYNFAGVAKWYKQNIDGSPTILPAFQGNKIKEEEKQATWVAPVKGKVMAGFSKEGRGIVLRTAKGAPVVASSEGWVVKAGTEEGLGQTVVIRHANGLETWYGWMGKVQIKEKEWVKPRQLLGEAGDREGDPLFFFAVKQKGAFVDPAGVVPFD